MSPEPTLPLPIGPTEPGPLVGPDDSLVRARPAGARPFLVASPRASVWGTELGGVSAIHVAGVEVLRGLTTGAGTCANVLLGPRSLRRELFGPGGSVLETVLASDRRPGAVVQWSASDGSGLALDTGWTVPGPASAHRSSGGILRVRPESGPDRIFALHPAPDSWKMESGGAEIIVRVRVRAERGAVTLLVGSAASNEEGGDLLRDLAATDALAVRAAAFSETVRTRRLSLASGVPEIDDGLAWAVARLGGANPESRALREAGPAERGALWSVIGALAAGDRATARDRLERSPTDVADVLALGWWVLWTGDVGPLERYRSGILEIVDGNRGDVVHRAARRTTRLALEAMGDHATAKRLRSRSAVRLPTLPEGGEPRGDGEAILAAVLGEVGPSVHPVRKGPRGPRRALHAWACFAGGHAEEGYALLRQHLADGLRGGMGLWSTGEDDGPPHDPVAAALAPAVVLNGLFGARSEAPWGRLRLAPQLPPTWPRVRLTGVHVGDARISIDYTSGGSTHTFVVAQTEGRVPVDLVLEPTVRGPVTSVLVDGDPTDVIPETTDGRSRVRLQIPLDRERRVDLLGPGEPGVRRRVRDTPAP